MQEAYRPARPKTPRFLYIAMKEERSISPACLGQHYQACLQQLAFSCASIITQGSLFYGVIFWIHFGPHPTEIVLRILQVSQLSSHLYHGWTFQRNVLRCMRGLGSSILNTSMITEPLTKPTTKQPKWHDPRLNPTSTVLPARKICYWHRDPAVAC